jgi:protein O-mannosyl-transferase
MLELKKHLSEMRFEAPSSNSWWRKFFSSAFVRAAFLISIVLAVYWPALNGGCALDDEFLTKDNPVMVAPNGLYRIWCTTDMPDYWPLTYSTFWLERRVWGVNLLGLHGINIALHAISALLLWAILLKLRIPGAYLAALLFAIHPVNVESIAWISQRKNALAMVFFLLSILWYLKGEESGPSPDSTSDSPTHSLLPADRVGRKWLFNRWHWLSLVGFVLALLSKGSVAILPALLLGLAWWRGSINLRELWRLAIFFLVAAIFVGVNIWFQAHANRGAIRDVSFLQRLLGAGGVIWFYLYKALWPFNLAFVYPQWQIDPDKFVWWLPLLSAIAVTVALYWQRQRPWCRPMLFAWGFFCVALLPVMGLTDVGFMRFSLVADHYQHIAIIGVLTLVTAAICTFRQQLLRIGRNIVDVGVLAVICTLLLLTWVQCGTYCDIITLYETAIEKNPGLWMLHGNLGDALYDAGHIQEAIPELREALRLYPDSFDAHFYLAQSLAKNHQWNEAIEHYQEAIRLRPDYMQACNELALLYAALGLRQEAIATAEKALEIAKSTGNQELQRQIEDWIVALKQ